MGNLLWAIVKDGLKALAFWAVASLVMIFLWGYTGRMLSLGLGMIFIVSFIGLNLKRIVTYFTGPGGVPAGSAGGGFPAIPPVTPRVGSPEPKPCPEGVDGWMTCPMCSGNGVRMQGGTQLETCNGCNGLRRVHCTRCGGSGYVYA